jgi:threonylcarbamoyladenosine tRNA methylthiotransferase MtaB
MPRVSGPETRARAASLRERGERALGAYLQAEVGRDVEILMERDGIGRTPGFAEVALAGSAKVRSLVVARVTRSDGARLQAEPLAPKCAQ